MMKAALLGRRGPVSAVGLGLAAAALLAAASAACAADCPGNPNALGTSRTLVIDPADHTKIGTMQYRETLPLRDHEVVLTFDDGPLPPHSTQVMQTLASECVKATFFIIGRMAKQFPDGVRRLYAAGHTIGTHSENHPLSFHHMPIERAQQEINDGIEHTAAALGDPAKVAPFFRIPGLLRAEGVEDYLASKGIMTWSADFPADDWRPISSTQVLNYALTRLEAKGKGVLLLHDIQGRTATMLPTLLRELKSRGYRIVHVVAATPDLPKTPTEPRDWLMHPDAPQPMAVQWPAVPRFVPGAAAQMPALDLADMRYIDDPTIFNGRDRVYRPSRFVADTVPLPPAPAWPRLPAAITLTATTELPIPDAALFRMPRLSGAGIRLARHGQHTQRPAPVTTETTGARPAAATARPVAYQSSAAAPRQMSGSWPVTTVGLQRGPITPH
ncbi:polysaccharide deacetylase family protein [Bradyrhizobium sp. 2TAF24]|uniref:polysaccharide deacetylase family protein n=1 Tax=Bradyrhizobium sp. 2TAF24 TaxID=3233011 RepID=UPI003F8DFCF7